MRSIIYPKVTLKHHVSRLQHLCSFHWRTGLQVMVSYVFTFEYLSFLVAFLYPLQCISMFCWFSVIAASFLQIKPSLREPAFCYFNFVRACERSEQAWCERSEAVASAASRCWRERSEQAVVRAKRAGGCTSVASGIRCERSERCGARSDWPMSPLALARGVRRALRPSFAALL